MSFWEKGYLTSAAIIVLVGIGYAATIWQASSAAGELVAPQLGLFLLAMVIFVVIAAASFSVIAALEARRTGAPEDVGEYDERDRLVGLHAQAQASHVMSFGIYMSLVAFFVHRDANVLFYSAFAAAALGDLSRCLLQVYHYNRAI